MLEGLTGITKSSYTGDDLISRQNIKYHTQLEAMGNGQYEEVEVAYKNDIESLPSADKVTGHIVTKYSGEINPTIWAVCSECEKPIDPWDRFCRYCGAKMVTNDE